MNITIVGAGNIGTQFAVHCAEKGHSVTMFGSKPQQVCRHLSIIDENGYLIHEGTIKCATDSPKIAFSDADLIFITVPAFCIEKTAKTIAPYFKEGMKICLVPGTGGGECSFASAIDSGVTIFGLQRVPSVARLTEYGQTVKATGYRNELFVAALPNNQTEYCCNIIENIFDMKCSSLPCYLNLTLTPSNPILHTTRLRILFNDFLQGTTYPSVPLFYEDWTDETSELLFKCDTEVQNICNALGCFDLRYVKSLKEHYESYTPQALTEKIRSIAGFKGLPSPIIQMKNGFIPDFNSRYFTADFSFGLSILVQIADMLNVSVPNMNDTMQWYHSVAKEENSFRFQTHHINNKEDLIDFYDR